MYNLYTYLNQVKKKENLIEEEKKKKKISKNLKYLNNIYANNFNDKLKNFIFEMCKEPIIVNNTSYDKKKIHQKNKFVFNQYINEKQRIENFLNQDKPFIKKKIKLKINKNNISNNNNNTNNNNNNDSTQKQ